jgi:acyl transferase domain-containing protein
VGTHLACTSFLGVDCPRALVCGINLTMRAETTAVLSKAGMLAQVTPSAGPHADSIVQQDAIPV